MTNIAVGNHHAVNGKIHYFDWAIFNSYVKLPEGTPTAMRFISHSKWLNLVEWGPKSQWLAEWATSAHPPRAHRSSLPSAWKESSKSSRRPDLSSSSPRKKRYQQDGNVPPITILVESCCAIFFGGVKKNKAIETPGEHVMMIHGRHAMAAPGRDVATTLCWVFSQDFNHP